MFTMMLLSEKNKGGNAEIISSLANRGGVERLSYLSIAISADSALKASDENFENHVIFDADCCRTRDGFSENGKPETRIAAKRTIIIAYDIFHAESINRTARRAVSADGLEIQKNPNQKKGMDFQRSALHGQRCGLRIDLYSAFFVFVKRPANTRGDPLNLIKQ